MVDDTKLLSEIIGMSADAILSIDEQKNIALFNPAAERIFGYDAEDILGKPLDILLPAFVHAKHDRYMADFFNSEVQSKYMGERSLVTGIKKGGESLNLDISIQKHPKGSAFLYSAICRDVSDQLKIENEIHINAIKFEALFNSSYQFVMLMSPSGVIQEVNETCLTTLRGDSEDFIGKLITECDIWVSQKDKDQLKSMILFAERQSSDDIAIKVKDLDGNEIHLSVALKKVNLSEKEDLLVLEGRDVTSRVNTVKLLVESEARLSRAQKIAGIGNWEWDVSKDSIVWSDEIYNIFEVDPLASQMDYKNYLSRIHPGDRDRVSETIENAIKGLTSFSSSHRIVCESGTIKYVKELGAVQKQKNGVTLLMDGTIQDITESWLRERELIKARIRAEQGNHSKVQFLATMSHELRTPLNAIIGFSDIIAKDLFENIGNPLYKEYAGDIHKSGIHLLDMINDILDVSRIDLGSIEPNYNHFEVCDMVKESVSLLTVRAEEKNIEIRTNNPEGISGVYLDKRLCKQILSNLLGNAIKFSKENDKVDVVINMDGGNLCLLVQDYGIGMEESELSKIFEPFSQVETAFSRNFDGVGLGLTIVKSLTEIQGGDVSVVSEPGLGTSFVVSLPAMEGEPRKIAV